MSFEVKVPDSTIWTGMAAVVGWVLAVERRLFGRPTRKEIKADLEEIKAHLMRQDVESEQHRERVRQSLHTTGIKVAVIESRLKLSTSDTGTVKSL